MPLILPEIDDVNRPYWDGAKQGELRLQRCTSCKQLRYPISTVCPNCLSTELEWETMSGRGTVYTFGVFRHQYNGAWSERVPYAVSIVQLEEGPFVISDLVDVAVGDVRIGLPVQVHFDQATSDVTVPRFAAA